jgi:formylglycine-generating enzyme required for sulfatase activity
MPKIRKLIMALLIIAILVSAAILISNLDMAVRTYHALESGTFSVQRLRYDMASFNFGQKAGVTPIATKVSNKDGMVQVFVPAGEFSMGKIGEPDKDSPQHKVNLDAFWMDQVEVSNAMYEKCVDANGCTLPAIRVNPYYGKWTYRNYPVVYVDWNQAKAYCEWAGRRLPTEAEWEKAARGTDKRKYPWGDTRPNPSLANFAESLIGEAVPVYRYPLGASPYGALNMVGNVREWVSDWFSRAYYSQSSGTNPTGPQTGTERSLRSGAYDADVNEILTTSRYKHAPQSAGLVAAFDASSRQNNKPFAKVFLATDFTDFRGFIQKNLCEFVTCAEG